MANIAGPCGAMISITKLLPCGPLREFVRYFQGCHAPGVMAPVLYPVAPRPEMFIDFYMGDPFRVALFGTAHRVKAAQCVIGGQMTTRQGDVVIGGRVDVFTIHFQPSGFARLFHVPMQQLTNRATETASVLGGSMRELHERLYEAPDFLVRKKIADGPGR